MGTSALSNSRGLPELISTWCQLWLDAVPVDVLFQSGHLSEVWGIKFARRPSVVIKIRPNDRRLAACTLAQQYLWAHDFPCPKPLAGPEPLGDRTATAEALVEGGSQLTTGHDSSGLFAAALARLVALAPAVERLPSLDPSPPWVGWDHHQPGIWPEPDDLEADLNSQVGPSWIEEAGARVRNRLLRPSSLPVVVGHSDWNRRTCVGSTAGSMSCTIGTAWLRSVRRPSPVRPRCSPRRRSQHLSECRAIGGVPGGL